VLGPSGAGKSTLLRVIAGLQRPSAGSANVLGVDIGRISERRGSRLRHAQIGYLDQRAETMLAPDLRVESAVALPLALRGMTSASRTARVDELLSATGLSDRRDALPGELSGGERQRVALCAALAHRPTLLLADEPTGELDARSAADVQGLIAQLAKAHRTTVVLVTHDPAAAEVADRAVRIRDGRIVEDFRDGRDALVVGRGGWLQLPNAMLASAGIGERASVKPVAGGVLISAAEPDGNRPRTVSASTTASTSNGHWQPVRVELREVSRGRGRGAGRRVVIDKLTLEPRPGQFTVVTGRSGSGKTTLLRMLAALDRPDTGEAMIAGVRLSSCDEEGLARLRLGRIGYLAQEPSPIGFLAADENVVLGLRLRGWAQDAAFERAATILARIGLSDRARQRVERLSAGESQRVALARALAAARGLLIADEPTSRLDEANAEAVADILARVAVEDGQTVVCATHDPELIRRAHEVVAL
jgi:ABC-type lipoprotein export system ATPase subunit